MMSPLRKVFSVFVFTLIQAIFLDLCAWKVSAQSDIFLSSPTEDRDSAENGDDQEEPALEAGPEVTQEPIKTPIASPSPSPTPEGQEDFFGNKIQATHPRATIPNKKGKVSNSAEEDERAIPINGIGLIVEADGSEMLRKVLGTYYRLVRERGIKPSLIYLVTNGRDDTVSLGQSYAIAQDEINRDVPPVTTMSNDELSKDPVQAQRLIQEFQQKAFNDPNFLRRLASAFTIVPSYHPPSIYPVSQLPSWYLLTDGGQILLEGLADPSNLITVSGKFVEPLGVSTEPTTIPVKKES